MVEPKLNGTKISLLVGGSGTCIKPPKHPAVPVSNVCEMLFIVNLVAYGEVVQVDPGGVQFFALIGLLVHQHRDYVL